jgi:hypothetical protein
VLVGSILQQDCVEEERKRDVDLLRQGCSGFRRPRWKEWSNVFPEWCGTAKSHTSVEEQAFWSTLICVPTTNGASRALRGFAKGGGVLNEQRLVRSIANTKKRDSPQNGETLSLHLLQNQARVKRDKDNPIASDWLGRKKETAILEAVQGTRTREGFFLPQHLNQIEKQNGITGLEHPLNTKLVLMRWIHGTVGAHNCTYCRHFS